MNDLIKHQNERDVLPHDEGVVTEDYRNPHTSSRGDSGTPITDYIVEAAPTPAAPSSPARIVARIVASRPLTTTPRSLRWAMRLTFALLGALLGTYFYWAHGDDRYKEPAAYQVHGFSQYSPSLWLWVIAPVAALLLTYLLYRRGNHALWGGIIVTLIALFPLTLLTGLPYYLQAIDSLNDPILLNKPSQPILAENYVWSLFFFAESIALILLAMFAVWQSQRGGRRLAGSLLLLILVATTLMWVLASWTHDLTPKWHYNYSFADSLGSLCGILFYVIPAALLVLYLLPNKRAHLTKQVDIGLTMSLTRWAAKIRLKGCLRN